MKVSAMILFLLTIRILKAGDLFSVFGIGVLLTPLIFVKPANF